MNTDLTMKKNLKYFWNKKILNKKIVIIGKKKQTYYYGIPDTIPHNSLIKKI